MDFMQSDIFALIKQSVAVNMADILFKQFDEDFAMLTATHNENIAYWNNVHEEVVKTVDELVNERQFIETEEKLDVGHLDISEYFPDIKAQVAYKMAKKAQSDEAKLQDYVSMLNQQTNQIIFLYSECSRSSSSLPFSVRGKPSKILENISVEVSSQVSNIYSETNKKMTTTLMIRAEQLQKSKCLEKLYRKTLNSLLGWLEGTQTDQMLWTVGKMLGETDG